MNMKAKSIVFVIDSLGDGGAEKVVLFLAEGFYKKGYPVHLITIKDHVVYEIPDGVFYHTMKFKKGLGIYRMLTDYRLKQRLIKKIRLLDAKCPVRVVFSHLRFADTILARTAFKFPIISTVHNTYSKLLFQNKSGIGRAFKCFKLQKVYNNKHIICVSDGVKQDLLKHVGIQPASIRTVYNPFPINEIRQKALETSGIRYKDFILHVGRFSPQKRHDILLKAFAQSGLDCQLVLLGSGTDQNRQSIKRIAMDLGVSNRVIMPGFSDNPYAWMKKARLFVLSSDFEGFSLVLVESLISGTPVISTDCPSGPSEILTDYPELLSPVGDIDALARNMSRYYHNSPAIDNRFLEKFSIETIVNQLEKAVGSTGDQRKN